MTRRSPIGWASTTCAALATAVEWMLGTWLFESPLAVVLPIFALVVVLGLAVVSIGTIALARGRRLEPITAALALIPLAWVTWQDHGRIRCEGVESERSGVLLSGTLCSPRSGRHPGVVIVHGSGPQTREEPLFYARFLARRGVAALAYDKRGSGASGGSTYEVGYDGYAADAHAFLEVLRGQPGVDSERVGYLGFSEAEWVIPIAIAKSTPAFVVLVGASGLPPERQVRESIGIRVARAGFSDEDASAAQRVHDDLHDYLRQKIDATELEAVLAEARGQPWFDGSPHDLPTEVWPRSEYAWWISVMDFSPEPYWQHFAGAALFVKGGLDDRSDASKLEPRIETMLPATVSTSFVIHPDADHTLLKWPLGDRVPPPRWPSGYPDILADWITARPPSEP